MENMTEKYKQQLTKIQQLEEDIERRIQKYGVDDEETKNRIITLNEYKVKCSRIAAGEHNAEH